MLGYQQISECKLFNEPSFIWAFRHAGPLVYHYWLFGTKLYASFVHANTSIALLMTGNALHDLTVFLISNDIGQIGVYGYGDNLMNPWIYMSVRKCLNWWCFWDGMKCMQLALNGTVDTSRNHSARWRVRKYPAWLPTPIDVHYAFRWTWTIPAIQCDIPLVKSCYRVVPVAFFCL